MKPLFLAIKGKGIWKTVARIRTLATRYGLTPVKMDQALDRFERVLAEYHCGASFPITAAALARSHGVVEKYQARNIEFAVHGYRHIDHSQLTTEQQAADFSDARRLFEERGIACSGFRSPYLRRNAATLKAIGETGFLYDSSDSLVWEAVNGNGSEAYHKVLEFYGSRPAGDYPALPKLTAGVVEIPYCLPDDESLIERLHFEDEQARSQPWLDILAETYRRGELFTLGLHPERIFLCEVPLRKVLEKARSLSPSVWIARLDEIAKWWKERSALEPLVGFSWPNEYWLDVKPLKGLTILGKHVEMDHPAQRWNGHTMQVRENGVRFKSPLRPFIGITPRSDAGLAGFLRQQGYIVEFTETRSNYSIFLDCQRFAAADERGLLEEIEGRESPLVRFGRWPDGAQSALSVTGDIDALTIWDYGLRALGK